MTCSEEPSAVPTVEEMVDLLTTGTRSAVEELRHERAGEHVYWWGLLLTGDGAGPSLTAWSHEALAHSAATLDTSPDELRWSYADAPDHPVGDAHLVPARAAFGARPMPAPDRAAAWDHEVELRLRVLEEAMSRLDAEGLFGRGTERDEVVLTVGMIPPDASDVGRARRLNPPVPFERWFAAAAEPDA